MLWLFYNKLQLNDIKIRGDNRLSINTGIGYRKLSESKSSFVGGNVFIDYDEEGNTRGSIGIELRASSFEALANYYQAISGDQKVGNFTERALDGNDISLDMTDLGEYKLVIFSCNHCPYAQAWEDRIIKIQEKYKMLTY